MYSYIQRMAGYWGADAGFAELISFLYSFSSTTSTAALPETAKIGDLLVINATAATATGGSGTPFATQNIGSSRISYRQLEANDFTTPIVMSGAGDNSSLIVRGAKTVSAKRSEIVWTAPYDKEIPGFSKQPDCVGILAVGYVDGAAIPYFGNGSDTVVVGSPLQQQKLIGITPNLYSMMAFTLDPQSIPDGVGVLARSNTNALSHTAALFELLAQ